MRQHALKCVLVILLAALMAFSGTASADWLETIPLNQNCPPMNALVTLGICVSDCGIALGEDSYVFDMPSGIMSIKTGVLTLSVHSGADGFADSVTVAASYLDADYALTMGKLFGKCLLMLGGFQSVDEIICSIDFNAMNTLTANTQTLIYGDYKVIVKIAPEEENPYQLTLSLLSAAAGAPAADAPDDEEAAAILTRMNADVSARFVYDENTDLNGLLGRADSYTSKVNFALTSITPDMWANPEISVGYGGSIEVFADAKYAYERANYLVQTQLRYFEKPHYCFVCKTALLRLSKDLPPEEVGRLIAAFIEAVNGRSVPAAAPTAAPTAVPTAAPIPAPTDVPGAACAVGDEVLFGRYEQDGSLDNGAEPIKWRVLDVSGGQAMLVSVMALDVWNINWDSLTWDNSTLRQWLNGDFFQNAFDETDRQALVLSTVKADKNPNYDSDPGQDTQDPVFCLSYPEADRLLTISQRRTAPTAYALQRGVYSSGGLCYWWLRSPGKPGCGAAIVGVDGGYDYDVAYDGFCYGVRPAIRVDLEKAQLGK